MKIVKEIRTCMDCRFRDHSGSYTPGGAKPICNGPNVIRHVAKAKGMKKPPDYIKHLNDSESSLHAKAVNYVHWKHRVIRPGGPIPSWCPLKQGEEY